MPASIQELDAFTDFVRRQLDAEQVTLSLEDCVRLWREQQEKRASINAILQSMKEDDAGLSQPLAEAFDDVRRQLGIVR